MDIFRERRTQKRIESDLDAYYKIIDNYKSLDVEYKKAKMKNISLGGICVLAENSLKIGNMVRVNFNLDVSSKLIDTFCEVEWCKREPNGYIAGLSFVGLSKEEEEIINKYISQSNN